MNFDDNVERLGRLRLELVFDFQLFFGDLLSIFRKFRFLSSVVIFSLSGKFKVIELTVCRD